MHIVEQMYKVFWPPVFGRDDLDFSTAELLVRFLSPFGRVPFAGFRLRSLAMKQNAEFTEGGCEHRSNFKPFVDQSSYRFETM